VKHVSLYLVSQAIPIEEAGLCSKGEAAKDVEAFYTAQQAKGKE